MGSYTNVLPSLNVRFGFTDKQFMRFGYSKGMSRPDFGLLRNSVAINGPPIDTSNSSPYLIKDAPGNVTGYNFVFAAEAGYAGLEPVEADNFDLSYEAYLSPSTSFTLGLFYKKLENTIAYGRAVRDITNNGSTQSVTIRGPSNDPGNGGTLKGFEIAYQTFFDNLPGAWAGLGVQANYTFTDQDDINNSNLAVQAGYLPGSTTAFGGGNNTSTGGQGSAGNPLSFTSNVIDSHRLAGISDDSFNVVGLYEFGKFGARLAYSWRSEFLTANLDCCIGLPVWQKANGYLDGSVRYRRQRQRRAVARCVEHPEYHCGHAAAGIRRFDADAGRESREAGFGLGQERPPLSARRAFQILTAFVGAVPPTAPTIFRRTRGAFAPAHRDCRRWFRRLDVRCCLRAGAASGSLSPHAHRVR